MRRWTIRICVLLLLGAIVNVAVAWGCVRWSSVCCDRVRVAIRARWRHDSIWIGIERCLGVGVEQHELMNTFARNIEPDADSIITSWAVHQQEATRTVAITTPHWSRLGIDPAKPDVVVEMDQASGWPLRALRCNILEYDQEGFYKASPSQGLVANRDMWPVSRVYPLGIVLPGFAINTIFYAAMIGGVWVLFAAPFALRRRRRAKRGLCPACAYPVGQSEVCTECGAPISRPRRPAPANAAP